MMRTGVFPARGFEVRTRFIGPYDHYSRSRRIAVRFNVAKPRIDVQKRLCIQFVVYVQYA